MRDPAEPRDVNELPVIAAMPTLGGLIRLVRVAWAGPRPNSPYARASPGACRSSRGVRCLYTRVVASKVADLIEAGLCLDADERAVVANTLFDSLHEPEATVDAAWADEIGRRVDEIVSGEVGLVDADEHYARLRAELAARRR